MKVKAIIPITLSSMPESLYKDLGNLGSLIENATLCHPIPQQKYHVEITEIVCGKILGIVYPQHENGSLGNQCGSVEIVMSEVAEPEWMVMIELWIELEDTQIPIQPAEFAFLNQHAIMIRKMPPCFNILDTATVIANYMIRPWMFNCRIDSERIMHRVTPRYLNFGKETMGAVELVHKDSSATMYGVYAIVRNSKDCTVVMTMNPNGVMDLWQSEKIMAPFKDEKSAPTTP